MLFHPHSIATAAGDSSSHGNFVEDSFANVATGPRQVGIVESTHDQSTPFPMDLALDGYSHRRIRTVPVHRLATESRFWSFSQLLPDPSIDLVHAINTIPLNARRFVVTLDGDASRHLVSASPWQVRLGQRILASPSCKKILVRSEIAARLFRQRCRASGVDGVESKIEVFHGYVGRSNGEIQSVVQSDRIAKARQGDNRALRLVFVGKDGLNSGLLPVLDAFESLRSDGVDVQLTIVSSLSQAIIDDVDTSALGRFAPSMESVRERIASESSISLVNFGSHDRMRSLIAVHDLLLVPSLIPVSGWQIIDAAMAGVPAITSNVFSLPELVRDGSSGIVIPLSLDGFGCWVGESLQQDQKRDAIIEANHVIRDKIRDSVTHLSRDRDRLKRFAMSATSNIQATFGNEIASQHLRQVYDHACR